MLRRHYNLSVLGLLLLGGAMVGLALRHDPLPPIAKVHSLRNWQTADAPDGYPVGATADSPGRIPGFDVRFRLLDAPERFQLPPAPRFDQPLGSEFGALVYNAQPFGSPNERRGGNHTGDDLNGIGGMDTDLGDPVYAAANGRVLFAGDVAAGWGKVIILGHRMPAGDFLHSMYAHLHRIDVPLGAVVSRGDRIGTVGTAGGHFPAHLHFEVRASDSIDLGAGYTRFASNRLDPTGTVRAHQPEGPAALAPPPLAIAIAEERGWENRLILEGADKVPALFGDDK
ncbi:MAG: M23 family metallopeptidase [Akkermansiaceae bacterium]|nr:M23 family metallopeptidase [Akkermansiaceae bacterium]